MNRKISALMLAGLIVATTACSIGRTLEGATLTVYSGRSEELVDPLFDLFTEATGIQVEVRYGDSAALAAQILEEGDNTPADVFFSQDGGALGALSEAEMLFELTEDILEHVPDGFRAADGTWIGTSGRARTVVYNTDRLTPADLPSSILGFTAERWRGRLGWAPTNASFQAFVTALRLEEGEEAARDWLLSMQANRIKDYPKNTPIVEAVAAGDIDAGFVNHYYLYQILSEDPDAPAANHFIGGGDVGALINVAGAGILTSTDEAAAAVELITYLVGTEAQTFFSEQTFEYPLIEGVTPDPRLPALDDLEPPRIDLSALADLEATLQLLAEVGAL